jgi:hypothetical protein
MPSALRTFYQLYRNRRTDTYNDKQAVLINRVIYSYGIDLLVSLRRIENKDTLSLGRLRIEKSVLNSVALVCKRTIPTERPPLVGEVSGNICGYRVLRGQHNEFPWPLISVFQTGADTFSFK